MVGREVEGYRGEDSENFIWSVWGEAVLVYGFEASGHAEEAQVGLTFVERGPSVRVGEGFWSAPQGPYGLKFRGLHRHFCIFAEFGEFDEFEFVSATVDVAMLVSSAKPWPA